jgi:hypothetical protein
VQAVQNSAEAGEKFGELPTEKADKFPEVSALVNISTGHYLLLLKRLKT